MCEHDYLFIKEEEGMNRKVVYVFYCRKCLRLEMIAEKFDC